MSGVVVLVPWRPTADPRRKRLWDYTRDWLGDHCPRHPVYTHCGPDGPFNRGAAINAASELAGDWDIAIICDADNICDPMALRWAIQMAAVNDMCVLPYRSYIYLDKFSSNRILDGDPCLPIPDWDEEKGQGYRRTVLREHASGIQVVNRKTFDAVGGYLELEGWGHEDEVMRILFKTFTKGLMWGYGGAYHLWHEHNRGRPDPLAKRNGRILADVRALQVVPDQLKEYLRAGGHPIP